MGQQWVASLANYDFKVYYKTGKSNVDADVLSHIPWDRIEDTAETVDTVAVKDILAGCSYSSAPFEPFIWYLSGEREVPVQSLNTEVTAVSKQVKVSVPIGLKNSMI